MIKIGAPTRCSRTLDVAPSHTTSDDPLSLHESAAKFPLSSVDLFSTLSLPSYPFQLTWERSSFMMPQ